MRRQIRVHVVECDRADCLNRVTSQFGVIDALERAREAGWHVGARPNDPDYCGQHNPDQPGIRTTTFEEHR
jgi:hypothetical protein